MRWATAEVRAEWRRHLLTALGFGADRMFYVPRVRCFGCPRFPFAATRVWWLSAREAIVRRLPADRYVDFEDVAVERRLPGRGSSRAIARDGRGGSSIASMGPRVQAGRSSTRCG